jgi:Uma2 family endonuclease
MIQAIIETLAAGDRLTRGEFFRRWEALPHIKRAELIGGKVFIMSPVSSAHGETAGLLNTVTFLYAAATPGCKQMGAATCVLADDVVEPDAGIRLLEKHGGRSHVADDGYIHGAPEFVAEASLSSAAYDLFEKKDLYESAGVQEYFVVLLRERETRFFRLIDRQYQQIEIPADGIHRSLTLPGLWLDTRAIIEGDSARVLQTVDLGVKSPEHQQFVQHLAKS